MLYHLLPDESASAAFKRLSVGSVDEALAALDEEDLKSGVHEARKACKRLRAVLRLFRSGLGKAFKKADRSVRDAARVMSATRDQDVLPQTLSKLAEAVTDPIALKGIEAIQTKLRDHVVVAEAPEDVVNRAVEELQALRETATTWRVRQARHAVADGVRTIYNQGRKDRQDCSIDGPAEPWHAWRKHVKYHGYHAKLLSQLHPVGVAYAEPWDRFGKLLGDEHDLSVLEERLTETTLSQAPAASVVLAAARERRAAIRNEAAQLGQKLYLPKPAAVKAIVLDLLPKR